MRFQRARAVAVSSVIFSLLVPIIAYAQGGLLGGLRGPLSGGSSDEQAGNSAPPPGGRRAASLPRCISDAGAGPFPGLQDTNQRYQIYNDGPNVRGNFYSCAPNVARFDLDSNVERVPLSCSGPQELQGCALASPARCEESHATVSRELSDWLQARVTKILREGVDQPGAGVPDVQISGPFCGVNDNAYRLHLESPLRTGTQMNNGSVREWINFSPRSIGPNGTFAFVANDYASFCGSAQGYHNASQSAPQYFELKYSGSASSANNIGTSNFELVGHSGTIRNPDFVGRRVMIDHDNLNTNDALAGFQAERDVRACFGDGMAVHDDGPDKLHIGDVYHIDTARTSPLENVGSYETGIIKGAWPLYLRCFGRQVLGEMNDMLNPHLKLTSEACKSGQMAEALRNLEDARASSSDAVDEFCSIPELRGLSSLCSEEGSRAVSTSGNRELRRLYAAYEQVSCTQQGMSSGALDRAALATLARCEISERAKRSYERAFSYEMRARMQELILKYYVHELVSSSVDNHAYGVAGYIGYSHAESGCSGPGANAATSAIRIAQTLANFAYQTNAVINLTVKVGRAGLMSFIPGDTGSGTNSDNYSTEYLSHRLDSSELPSALSGFVKLRDRQVVVSSQSTKALLDELDEDEFANMQEFQEKFFKIFWPDYNTANQHWPMTRAVLVSPIQIYTAWVNLGLLDGGIDVLGGESCELPPEWTQP